MPYMICPSSQWLSPYGTDTQAAVGYDLFEGRASLPFYFTYTLLAGSGTRMADSAAAALIAYHELESIGARAITIPNESGRPLSIEELVAAARAKMKGDREGEPSG
jgi:hypothetical protein